MTCNGREANSLAAVTRRRTPTCWQIRWATTRVPIPIESRKSTPRRSRPMASMPPRLSRAVIAARRSPEVAQGNSPRMTTTASSPPRGSLRGAAEPVADVQTGLRGRSYAEPKPGRCRSVSRVTSEATARSYMRWYMRWAAERFDPDPAAAPWRVPPVNLIDGLHLGEELGPMARVADVVGHFLARERDDCCEPELRHPCLLAHTVGVA